MSAPDPKPATPVQATHSPDANLPMRSGRTRPLVQLILPDLRGGGAERTSLNLQRQLADGPLDVQIVLMDARGEYLDSPEHRDWILPPGAWLRGLARRCKPDSPERAVLQVPQMMRLIVHHRPDVIMTSMADISIPMAVALALLPRSWRPFWIARDGNNAKVVLEEAYPDARVRRWIERIMTWSYRAADVVLVPSRGVGECLEEFYGLPMAGTQVIGNPADLERVRARAAEAPEVALPLRFIVGVGRLAVQKGFDVLLRALALLQDREIALVLCGVGPEREALTALAEELGLSERVFFAGFQENPWAIMARAQAFCLSSRWEGFGHVVVEAMACGTPVVTTDCDYGPGEIVRAGVDGWVVPVDDPAALATALDDVLAHPDEARSRVEHAQERAEDFDTRTIAAAYARLFATGHAFERGVDDER